MKPVLLGLGLARFNNFTGSGAEGLSLVIWYVALGWLGQADTSWVWETYKGGGWGEGSGSVDLHLKGTLCSI